MHRKTISKHLSRSFASTTHASAMKTSLAAVVPVPFSFGQPNCGPNQAPTALFEAGLVEMLGRLQWRVQQEPPFDAVYQGAPSGDVEDGGSVGGDAAAPPAPPIKARNPESVGYSCNQIFQQMTRVVGEDRAGRSIFPLIIGGDHSIR